MTVVKCIVFDSNGSAIAELVPEYASIAWRLNNAGKARFSMPYTDPKCTPTNLAYGNRILFQFDSDLPDWGGVIDTPRKRTGEGVNVNAYTGERLFDWRRTVKARYFTSQEPGYIAQSLLQEISAIWPVGVDVGSIYMGGDGRTLEYHYHDLLQRYKDLAKLSGMDFAVIPSYSSGTISFTFNWYESRGSDKSNQITLIENVNCSGVVLNEQGQIANVIKLAGAGDNWGVERLTSEAEDATSRNLYGYREYSETQSGVSEQATLDSNADEILAEMKDPTFSYAIGRALNKKPALYSSYDVGDTIGLKALLNSHAWQPVDTTVRIISREWVPDGTVSLVVQ